MRADVDSRALGVQLEAMRIGGHSCPGRDLARLLADRHRGQLDRLVGECALRTDARHGLAVDAAFVHFNPTGAVQRMERSVDLKLRIEGAGTGRSGR